MRKLSQKALNKQDRKRQKVFNSYVNCLTRKIKRGCIKSAKNGLYKFEYDIGKFRWNIKENIELCDIMFCIETDFLKPNKISLDCNLGFSDILIFE